MSQVRASAQFVATRSTDVHVNSRKCKEIAARIKLRMESRGYSPATWSSHPLNPDAHFPDVVNWIFTIDTLNFSFWSDEPRFTVRYKGANYTGYWSLVAAVNRALDEGIPITSPSFWISKEFGPETLARVFRSENDEGIPLFNDRVRVLREAGEALAKAGYTDFADVVRNCDHSALALVDWVTSHISSYNDTAEYGGATVYLYKRAQILVGDLWGCFQGQGLGQFYDIDEITMFADYRVPQILYALGCIEYSSSLLEHIRQKRLLESGSRVEVEIRACSIWAVELIVGQIDGVNAVLADFFLWDTAKEEEAENTRKVECHRVRSVYY